MICVENLTKIYGKTKVVNDLSFTVNPGKITGFVGNNGVGKTTTMLMMLGLKKTNGGRILYNNKSLSAYVDPLRVASFVSNDDIFNPGFTVREYLRSLAILFGIPKVRVEEVTKEVGLVDQSNKTIKKLSNGMKQKLKIAAAILAEPKYLILDEPFNGLDPENVKWLRNFLQNYVKNGERAVFISSHILIELA